MSKRFTDTEKWKKTLLKSLKPKYKLLWLYILDDCDHAGIWQVDIEIAAMRVGERLVLADALKVLEGKIYPFDNGEKWFLPDFIEFQYGELNSENRAHNSVITLLKKYDLYDKLKEGTIKNEIINKPLISPLQAPSVGAMDKDKDKDKDMVKDKDKVKPKIIFPYETEIFLKYWNTWLNYRCSIKKKYKSIESEQAALMQLSKYNEEFSIKLIETSIANGWQGLIFQKTDTEFKNFINADTKQLASSRGEHYHNIFNELDKYHQGQRTEGDYGT